MWNKVVKQLVGDCQGWARAQKVMRIRQAIARALMQSVAHQLSAGRVVTPAAEEPLPPPLLEACTALAAVVEVADSGVVGTPDPPPSSSSSSAAHPVTPPMPMPVVPRTLALHESEEWEVGLDGAGSLRVGCLRVPLHLAPVVR